MYHNSQTGAFCGKYQQAVGLGLENKQIDPKVSALLFSLFNKKRLNLWQFQLIKEMSLVTTGSLHYDH